MKKPGTLMAIMIGLLLTTLLISGCQSILVTRNGDTETRQFNFTEFTRVDIGSAFRYEIKQSDTYSISITANADLFDDIKVAKEGQTLKIEREAPWTLFNIGSDRSKVVITMPQLYHLGSSGATSGVVSHFSSRDDLDITVSGASSVELVKIVAGDIIFGVSGSSKVTGDIEAKNMELEVSGASTVQLKGSAGSIAADVSGASHLKLEDLKVENADVVLSGASNGTINLNGRLDADLSGASTLEYIGDPALGIMDITRASTLKKK